MEKMYKIGLSLATGGVVVGLLVSKQHLKNENVRLQNENTALKAQVNEYDKLFCNCTSELALPSCQGLPVCNDDGRCPKDITSLNKPCKWGPLIAP